MSRAGREPLVLVVDDDRDTRELYRACLDTNGYHTAEASTGSQAIAWAVEIIPDVLLTDYRLPDVDGLTIARRLKADARTAAIGIVMVTGYANPALEHRAAGVGIDRVFSKPCQPQTVMREVSRVISRNTLRRPAAPLAASHQPDGSAAARVRTEFASLPGLALTLEQARLVFDLDRERCDSILNALVAEGFLNRTPHGAFTRPR